MKDCCHSTWGLLSLLLCGAGLGVETVQSASHVASPNLLWHNKVTGQNRVWIMSGTNFFGETSLPATPEAPEGRIIGTGDFDRDGQPDIVWQNETTGQATVWFMKGTNRDSVGTIPTAGDVDWKMAAVGDFNDDGKPDLVWQNLRTVQNAVWLMNGLKATSYNMIVSNGDANWRIVTAADFNADGKPDLVLRNVKTGQNAIWFMNGLNMLTGDVLRYSAGMEAATTDQDWRIVGVGDYNGDGKIDLVWRHATLGLSAFWYLRGNVVLGTSYFPKQDFDVDWRLGCQDLSDSFWRLQTASYTSVRAAVAVSPPQVLLTFNLVANSGFGATVQRRSAPDSPWTTLTSGLRATNYTDSTVVSGKSYEYKVFREAFGGTPYSTPEHLCVAVNSAPIEDRGRVIVLVDKTLAHELSSSLEQLTDDLIGDGWKVTRHEVPRHIDDYASPASFRTNAFNITNVIKPLIRSTYGSDPTNTKALLLVGHVSIPYSGNFSVDGHVCGPRPTGPDHRGAWPSDLFYGDLDGTWTDTTIDYTNCDFGETANVPGDGRFDQDGIPSPFVLKLAVGRIDFARLPLLSESSAPGRPARSEAALVRQYLNKNHQYRWKQLAWQRSNPAARAIVYGHFQGARDNPIFENAANAILGISSETNALVVGDFCLQRSKPYLWGFLAGPGLWDRVNEALPVVEHSSDDITNPVNEPTTAFSMVLASYMGDWNLRVNNFLRCLLSGANYGLASLWTRYSLWRLDGLGCGEHLGSAQIRMVNDPKNAFYERSREMTILGDPTLRQHVLAPPGALTATATDDKVDLSWGASEPGAQYYLYRGSSAQGPFERLSAEPVTTTRFSDSAPNADKKVYRVRALKAVTVNIGTYTNISQAVTATVH